MRDFLTRVPLKDLKIFLLSNALQTAIRPNNKEVETKKLADHRQSALFRRWNDIARHLMSAMPAVHASSQCGGLPNILKLNLLNALSDSFYPCGLGPRRRFAYVQIHRGT
jgi:hypothetical protein